MVRQLENFESEAVIKQVLARANPESHFPDAWDPSFGGRAWSILAAWNASVSLAWFDLEGNPQGFLVGFVTPDTFTGRVSGIVYLWVVVPEFQGRGVGAELFKTFENVCRARGAYRVVAGLNVNARASRMRKLYGNLGFVPVTEEYTKVLD